MNVIILTSSIHGSASYHLQHLIRSQSVNITAVVLSEGIVSNRKKKIRKKIKKTFRIGLLGALNGLRIRKWYSPEILSKWIEIKPINELCDEFGVPFFKVPYLNSPQTIAVFNKVNVDLGISLGNGYIQKSIFTLPKLGMINIHHEVLPSYQNAQSIIWQLYNGSSNTGYTIHLIEKSIDTGEILYQEIIPIQFRNSLSETVSFNYAELWKKSAMGLVQVLENYEYFFSQRKTQSSANSYTTPSIYQFFRILRQFNKLKKLTR